MPTPLSRSRHYLLLTALTAAIAWTTWFSGAGQLGLVGPDEPRYASIARAMAESGDWVTPRLNGEPWFEKPVLYYWGAAAAFTVFGASDAAARAPSALAMSLAALALVALARRLRGETSLALAFVLPSTLATIAFARAASMDMVFAAMLTLAFVAGSRLAELLAGGNGLAGAGRTRERRLWELAWGAALGLAVLAKGPAAVLLAGASVGAWALLMRRWRLAFAFAHPVSLAAFAAVALPWYVLCAMRNPEFLRVFLFEHNVQRFLTPVFAHEQPWWYFGGVLAAGLLPWTALLLPAVRDAWRDIGTRRDPVAVLALCWAVVPFVFFSVSRSKLPGYILPMFPPLALLIARSLADAIASPGRGRVPLASVGATLLGLGGALGLAAPAVVPTTFLPVVEALGLHTWGIAMAASGAGIVLLSLRERSWLALGLTATVMAILVIGVTGRVMPTLDPLLTSRAAAAAALREARGGPIYEFGLERTMDYGLDYYLRRDVPEWSPKAGEGVVVVRATTARTFAASGYLVEIIERISPDAVITKVQRLDTMRLLRLN